MRQNKKNKWLSFRNCDYFPLELIRSETVMAGK